MKVERIVIIILALALMLTLGVRLGQAQIQGPIPTLQSESNRPAAALVDQIPIQGRLTDASGNPLNGSYTVNFYIYDAAVGGTLLCGNLVTTVSVTNGLFNHTIDLCAAAGAIKGDQLYLGVKVGADPEMTPRQPIYSVPYAYTVRPGATIKGATSYVSVPGTLFVKEVDTDTTRWDLTERAVLIRRGGVAIGTKHIRIPITIPTILYGQPVRVINVTVYYKCEDGTLNYVSETELYKQTSADTSVSLVTDSTNRTSNTATSYSLTTSAANNTFSSGDALTLRLGLYFNDDIHYVQIGAVRVRLDTDY